MKDITLTEVMAAYAEDALDLALDRFATPLDFSIAHVQLLDAILDHYHRAVSAQKPHVEQVDAMIKIWGAYLGETIRRQWGGTWKAAASAPLSSATLQLAGTELFPLDRVRQRILNGAEANVWHYVTVLAKLLGEASPEGRKPRSKRMAARGGPS